MEVFAIAFVGPFVVASLACLGVRWLNQRRERRQQAERECEQRAFMLGCDWGPEAVPFEAAHAASVPPEMGAAPAIAYDRHGAKIVGIEACDCGQCRIGVKSSVDSAPYGEQDGLT